MEKVFYRRSGGERAPGIVADAKASTTAATWPVTLQSNQSAKHQSDWRRCRRAIGGRELACDCSGVRFRRCYHLMVRQKEGVARGGPSKNDGVNPHALLEVAACCACAAGRRLFLMHPFLLHSAAVAVFVFAQDRSPVTAASLRSGCGVAIDDP